MLTDLVDRADSGMVKTSGSSCLLEKARALRRGQVPGQRHLDRNQPVESQVARLVDGGHAALTQELEDLVIWNRWTGLRLGCCRCLPAGGEDGFDDLQMIGKPLTVLLSRSRRA